MIVHKLYKKTISTASAKQILRVFQHRMLSSCWGLAVGEDLGIWEHWGHEGVTHWQRADMPGCRLYSCMTPSCKIKGHD